MPFSFAMIGFSDFLGFLPCRQVAGSVTVPPNEEEDENCSESEQGDTSLGENTVINTRLAKKSGCFWRFLQKTSTFGKHGAKIKNHAENQWFSCFSNWKRFRWGADFDAIFLKFLVEVGPATCSSSSHQSSATWSNDHRVHTTPWGVGVEIFTWGDLGFLMNWLQFKLLPVSKLYDLKTKRRDLRGCDFHICP